MAQNPTVSALANADRTIDLPSDVVDNILKRLPLPVAVRTSILSKGWRYKWRTIPDLVFELDLERPYTDKYGPETINRILAVHRGPIVKFTLSDVYIDDLSTVGYWIRVLANHPIVDLTLNMYYVNAEEMVPHQLFSFVHLKYLSLLFAKVRFPSAFEGFNGLLKLSLEFVDFDLERGFNMLISKCPMLEHLHVIKCNTGLSIVIDAPNLKIFRFEGKYESIVFKNVKIEEMSVFKDDFSYYADMHQPGSRGNECNLIKVFGELSSVRKLAADGHFLKFLAGSVVPRKLPNNVNHLTSLELSYVDFMNMDQVTCALCLIRSCPSLETLAIECTTHGDVLEVFTVIQHLRTEQRLGIPLSYCLKNVVISRFKCSKIQREFVKLLLLGAVVLRELKLDFCDTPGHDDEIKEFMYGFPRASPEAVIIVG